MPTPTTPTLADILGALTPDAIRRVSDKTTKAQLESAYAFIHGAATTLLDTTGKSDHLIKGLGEIHVGLEDLHGLVADALAIIAELEDRDAKQAAYHTAVSALQTSEAELHTHLSSYSLLLRGKLGAKSAELTRFGFAPLAPGGRRKAQPAPTPTTPTTPTR
jgi:hypothetical protein